MSEINWNWSNAHTLQTHHNQVHSKNLLQSTYFKKASKLAKKVKVAYTRLPSVGSQSWSRFLAVSLQVMWVINPAVDCHYCLQLPPQPLRGLLPVLLLGEQRHNGCEQFAQDCYPTASRLRFEPELFCAWAQLANHSATEPPQVLEILFISRQTVTSRDQAHRARVYTGVDSGGGSPPPNGRAKRIFLLK